MDEKSNPMAGDSFGRSFYRKDLGVAVTESFIMGRTSKVAIGVGGIVAYRHGFAFNVLLSVRDSASGLTPLTAYRLLAERREIQAVQESGAFRLELQFANGGRASSIESIVDAWSPTSDRPMLMTQRGTGGDGWWEMACLAMPLPPTGPLRFISHWSDVGESFEHVIDAAPIVAAAERSLELW